MEGTVFADSIAAIGVASRKGNGKLRHVKVGTLWIQERVEEGDIRIKNVAGEENPADMMTNNLPERNNKIFFEMLQKDHRDGRAETSLELERLETRRLADRNRKGGEGLEGREGGGTPAGTNPKVKGTPEG